MLTKLWIAFWAMALAAIKTVWIGVGGRDDLPKFTLILVIAVVFKIVTMLFIAITAMRAS